MAIDVPGGILKQTDVRETITNTEETGVGFNVDYARFVQEINPPNSGSVTGIHFNPEGTKFYTVDTNDNVVEYTLTKRWDLSTMVYVHTLDVSAKETDLVGLSFSPDGLKMYTAGANGNSIDEYDLGTAWALSTAVYLQEFDISGAEDTVEGMFMREDGKLLVIAGDEADRMNSYSLSTAWDITTASLLDSTALTKPAGMWFSRNGLKVFWMRQDTDVLSIYDLTSPFRISTASAATNSPFTPFPSLGISQDVFFNPNGTKMYLTDNATIFEYTLKKGWR